MVAEALGFVAASCGTRAFGSIDLARRGHAFGTRHVCGCSIGVGTTDVLTDAAIRNAMVLHAAFGGSTNLLLHVPAIAHAAGLRRPHGSDWASVNRMRSAARGRASEWAKQLRHRSGVSCGRRAGGYAAPAAGGAFGLQCADGYRRQLLMRISIGGSRASDDGALKEKLRALDGIDADDVILSPDRARARGLTATICFPVGNLAPEGSVIKSTSIDPSLIDANNTYRHTGPARVFISERSAIDAIKSGAVSRGDVVVLVCGGPAGRHARDLPDHFGVEEPAISVNMSPC